jgi:mono/diheme cytochrome c family protein
MVLWKTMALAAAVAFPAAAFSVGVAAFGSDSVAELSWAGDIVVAQTTTEPPAEQPADAAAEEPTTEEVTTGEDEAAAEEGAEEEAAVFTDEYLHDPANIEAGKVVWETCAGCHGSRAYPGKAPKLRPSRYEPDFVFDRVTNGYKKMPPWKDVFTKEERMAVVAWILSDDFTP